MSSYFSTGYQVLEKVGSHGGCESLCYKTNIPTFCLHYLITLSDIYYVGDNMNKQTVCSCLQFYFIFGSPFVLILWRLSNRGYNPRPTRGSTYPRVCRTRDNPYINPKLVTHIFIGASLWLFRPSYRSFLKSATQRLSLLSGSILINKRDQCHDTAWSIKSPRAIDYPTTFPIGDRLSIICYLPPRILAIRTTILYT